MEMPGSDRLEKFFHDSGWIYEGGSDSLRIWPAQDSCPQDFRGIFIGLVGCVECVQRDENV